MAKIAPMRDTRSESAKERLLRRLRSQPVRNVGPWTREEFYDDQVKMKVALDTTGHETAKTVALYPQP